jgi:AraC family transcriptional regulator
MPRTAIRTATSSIRPRTLDLSGPVGLQKVLSYVLPVERNWRITSDSNMGSHDRNRIRVSRWQLYSSQPLEQTRQNDSDRYLIAVNLQSTHATLRLARQLVLDGPVTPGMIQITSPDRKASVLYRSQCDVLHLSVPAEVISREYERTNGTPFPDDLWAGERSVFPDLGIDRLARAITGVGTLAAPFGRLYVENIARAIVVRILGRCVRPNSTSRVNKLPLWRLRRAIEYVEQNLTQSIQLADIAASVGLTSMHFACQFRLTTGFSPHAYLLRRRLEQAQMLLQNPDATVYDVALRCGFSTHAHFTAAFKRHTGYSPLNWRSNC